MQFDQFSSAFKKKGNNLVNIYKTFIEQKKIWYFIKNKTLIYIILRRFTLIFIKLSNKFSLTLFFFFYYFLIQKYFTTTTTILFIYKHQNCFNFRQNPFIYLRKCICNNNECKNKKKSRKGTQQVCFSILFEENKANQKCHNQTYPVRIISAASLSIERQCFIIMATRLMPRLIALIPRELIEQSTVDVYFFIQVEFILLVRVGRRAERRHRKVDKKVSLERIKRRHPVKKTPH